MVLTAVSAGLVPAAANAQLLYMPDDGRRMAVTDYDSDSGMQPRVWVVTHDHYLASKAADQTVDAWELHSCCTESGLDAVSYTDGSTQRQRVFLARGDLIQQYVFDNDTYGGLSALPAPPSGTEFRWTDVAAVTWNDGGTRRVAVASISNNGRTCVWEGTSSGFPYAPVCSADSWAHTSLRDIHGTVVNGSPWFGYRLANGRLGRTRRSSIPTAWYHYDLGVPPGETRIGASVVAYPSLVDSSKVEFVVVGGSGMLRGGRVAPTSGSVTWFTLPTMPGGASPSIAATTLSSASNWYYDFFGGGFVTRNVLFVRGSDSKLYRLQSHSSGSYGTWLSGGPGSAAFPGGEETWLGTGAAASVGTLFSSTSAVFGVGGKKNWFIDTTLQEFRETGFRDHVRKGYSATSYNQMLGNDGSGSAHANESTVSQNTLFGLASAIRRQNPDGTFLPWRIALSSTYWGGDDWEGDYIQQPVDGWFSFFAGIFPSMSDPYTAMDPTGNRGHHLALEVALNGSGTSCAATENRRLVYRRQYGASAIASLTSPGADLVVIEAGNGLDHGNIVMTEEAQGVAIHAAYWRQSDTHVRYWRYDPVSGPTGPFTVFVVQRAMHQLHGHISDRTVLYPRWASRWAIER